MEPSLNIRSFRIGNLVYNPHLERIGYIAEITRADMTLFHGEMLIKEAGFYHEILDKVVLGDVRPIRLTPTLLEKCGFEKEFSDCYQRFDYYIIPRVICLSPKRDELPRQMAATSSNEPYSRTRQAGGRGKDAG